MSEKTVVRVLVIAAAGDRLRVFPVNVACTEDERADGCHYDEAKEYVQRQYGLRGPCLTWDEKDQWFAAHEWATAPTVTVTGC